MTRKRLRNIILLITIFYLLAIVLGIFIYFSDNADKKTNYAIFKDLIPFMITIPLAYLGYCFQQRANYLQALRPLWSHLILSVNTALEFTQKNSSSQEDLGKTLLLLSVSIDEVRGVYRNLNIDSDGTGYYPFESLKSIYNIIKELGYGETDKATLEEARVHINHNWINLRKTFLLEFELPEPTVFDSPYISGKKVKSVKVNGNY